MAVLRVAGSVYAGSLASSSCRAVACRGVGLVRRVKVCSESPMRRVLRHWVPRSARRSGRVWARWPWLVRALAALVCADGERVAGATGSVGALGASSVNSSSARRWCSSNAMGLG